MKQLSIKSDAMRFSSEVAGRLRTFSRGVRTTLHLEVKKCGISKNVFEFPHFS